MDSLVKAIKKIEMPDDMRKRIADNCSRELIDMDKADQPLIINGNWECEFEF